MSASDLSSLIQSLVSDIKKIRYIILTPKTNNITNDEVTNYLSSSTTPSNESDFLSISVPIISCVLIKSLIRNIFENLIYSSIDSQHGISLQTEDRFGKCMTLNTKRTHVLRQYYGKDINMADENTIMRYTYGFKPYPTVVTPDPNKFVTKPFCDKMEAISFFITMQLRKHRTEYK